MHVSFLNFQISSNEQENFHHNPKKLTRKFGFLSFQSNFRFAFFNFPGESSSSSPAKQWQQEQDFS